MALHIRLGVRLVGPWPGVALCTHFGAQLGTEQGMILVTYLGTRLGMIPGVALDTLLS